MRYKQQWLINETFKKNYKVIKLNECKTRSLLQQRLAIFVVNYRDILVFGGFREGADRGGREGGSIGRGVWSDWSGTGCQWVVEGILWRRREVHLSLGVERRE